jgi:hypothetical protein
MSSEMLTRHGRRESGCWTVVDRLPRGGRCSAGARGHDDPLPETVGAADPVVEADTPGGGETAEP